MSQIEFILQGNQHLTILLDAKIPDHSETFLIDQMKSVLQEIYPKFDPLAIEIKIKKVK